MVRESRNCCIYPLYISTNGLSTNTHTKKNLNVLISLASLDKHFFSKRIGIEHFLNL